MGDDIEKANPLTTAMRENPLGRARGEVAQLRDHWARHGIASLPFRFPGRRRIRAAVERAASCLALLHGVCRAFTKEPDQRTWCVIEGHLSAGTPGTARLPQRPELTRQFRRVHPAHIVPKSP